MSTSPIPKEVVVDDPKRPWKAYIAAAVAIAITTIQVIQAQGKDGSWSQDDTWTTVLAFLGAVLVYVVENPKTTRAI